MSVAPFGTKLVFQYTFKANAKLIACIFTDIADVGKKDSTNVRSYLQLYDPSTGLTLLKLVPGNSFQCDACSDPQSILNKSTQTSADTSHVESVLSNYCLGYSKTKVLYVATVSNVPGVLAHIQALFNAGGVLVLSSEIEESTFQIYEVDHPDLAVQLLSMSLADQNSLIDNTLRCTNVKNDSCKSSTAVASPSTTTKPLTVGEILNNRKAQKGLAVASKGKDKDCNCPQ
jgi:hypothetical protein